MSNAKRWAARYGLESNMDVQCENLRQTRNAQIVRLVMLGFVIGIFVLELFHFTGVPFVEN